MCNNNSMNDERISILGFNIKVERLRKKLTQEKLAELVNLSLNSITKIEGGKQVPSCLVLYDISKVLEIDLNELYKGLN